MYDTETTWYEGSAQLLCSEKSGSYNVLFNLRRRHHITLMHLKYIYANICLTEFKYM